MKQFDSEQVLKDIISNLIENKNKLYEELIETDEGALAVLKATRKYEVVGKVIDKLKKDFAVIDTYEFTGEVWDYKGNKII